MNQSNRPVVQGPLEKILADFAKAFGITPGSSGMYVKVKLLGDIIDVPEHSVVAWFRVNSLPTGERRAKLLLLLSLCGYEADERKEMAPYMVTLSDTVVTVTGVDEAVKFFGTTSANLLIWLRGPTKPKDVTLVQEFNHQFSLARKAGISMWKSKLAAAGFAEAEPQQVVASVKEVVPQVKSPPLVSDEIIQAAGAMVLVMKPFIDLLLSDTSTPEMRDAFRKAAGQSNVFELKNALTRLCGETAFKKT